MEQYYTLNTYIPIIRYWTSNTRPNLTVTNKMHSTFDLIMQKYLGDVWFYHQCSDSKSQWQIISSSTMQWNTLSPQLPFPTNLLMIYIKVYILPQSQAWYIYLDDLKNSDMAFATIITSNSNTSDSNNYWQTYRIYRNSSTIQTTGISSLIW